MANKFEEKKIEMDILSDLFKVVEQKAKDAHTEFRCVGITDEQATHWKTGELLWEDESCTVPKMKEKWEYVEVPYDELSENNRITIKVCEKLMVALEKMI